MFARVLVPIACRPEKDGQVVLSCESGRNARRYMHVDRHGFVSSRFDLAPKWLRDAVRLRVLIVVMAMAVTGG